MVKQGFAALLALGAASAFAVPLASSSFDTGAEGWTAQNGVSSFQWVASGGQSGGFVRAVDSGGAITWFFNAPAAYLGDKSAAYGGSLSFFLRALPANNFFTENYADVKLVGASLTLAIDAGPTPGATWTGYNVPLVAGQWHINDLNGPVASAAQVQSVLGSLSAVRIRGEFSNSQDVGGLDSVVLSAPVPAVPEPATSVMLVAGMLSLTLLMRRR